MARKKAAAKKRVEVPVAVWSAMAQFHLHPEELKEWQVTEDDIHLHLRNDMHLRVERSSLLERFTSELQPGKGTITKADLAGHTTKLAA